MDKRLILPIRVPWTVVGCRLGSGWLLKASGLKSLIAMRIKKRLTFMWFLLGDLIKQSCFGRFWKEWQPGERFEQDEFCGKCQAVESTRNRSIFVGLALTGSHPFSSFLLQVLISKRRKRGGGCPSTWHWALEVVTIVWPMRWENSGEIRSGQTLGHDPSGAPGAVSECWQMEFCA